MATETINLVDERDQDPYPVPYDPTLDADSLHGGLSLPRPGTTRSLTPTWQEKYAVRKIPGYTGYIPGAKFGMARTPYPTQVEAKKTLRADLVERSIGGYGFEETKQLPTAKTFSELPNLHPDDHGFSSCRPPNIEGNPSNKHNMTFGDPRVPGTYSKHTTYRDTFRGPRSKLMILGETPLTDIYKTPADLKAAYDRALLRAGKTKMEGLLKAMSNRIHAKLTNNGASAFQMRKRIERLTGIEGDDVQIDEMRKLMMTVCGITLEEEDLLALFGMYDKNCRGSISTAELMEVLVDKDYFNFFMGNNLKLKKELTVVTDSDKRAFLSMRDIVEEFGDMVKAFDYFDSNRSGRISRSELMLGFERRHMPLSPAGVDVLWSKADTSRDGFLEIGEFQKIFGADYSEYVDSLA